MLAGGLIAIGGFNEERLDSVEGLLPDNPDKWQALAPLPLPLEMRCAVYFRRRVLVVGGLVDFDEFSTSIYVFKPPALECPKGQWVTLQTGMPRPLYPVSLTTKGRRLLLVSKFLPFFHLN